MPILEIKETTLRAAAFYLKRAALFHQKNSDTAGAEELGRLGEQLDDEADELKLPPFRELEPVRTFGASSPLERGEPRKAPLASELAHKMIKRAPPVAPVAPAPVAPAPVTPAPVTPST